MSAPEFRLCTACEKPHYENCPTCLGFGVYGSQNFPVNFPVWAGGSSPPPPVGELRPCPTCGSTIEGPPAPAEPSHEELLTRDRIRAWNAVAARWPQDVASARRWNRLLEGRVRWWVPAAAILAAWALVHLAACARLPLVGPAFDVRDRWVYGETVKVERNEDYEPPCRLWCRLRGSHQDDFPRAYDAVVVDSAGKKHEIMFFAPVGNIIPFVGQVGWWHLWPESIVNFAGCNSYGCPRVFVWQLHPDEDLER